MLVQCVLLVAVSSGHRSQTAHNGPHNAWVDGDPQPSNVTHTTQSSHMQPGSGDGTPDHSGVRGTPDEVKDIPVQPQHETLVTDVVTRVVVTDGEHG